MDMTKNAIDQQGKGTKRKDFPTTCLKHSGSKSDVLTSNSTPHWKKKHLASSIQSQGAHSSSRVSNCPSDEHAGKTDPLAESHHARMNVEQSDFRSPCCTVLQRSDNCENTMSKTGLYKKKTEKSTPESLTTTDMSGATSGDNLHGPKVSALDYMISKFLVENVGTPVRRYMDNIRRNVDRSGDMYLPITDLIELQVEKTFSEAGKL